MRENDRLLTLRKRAAQAPTESGIYKWLDENGRVLYVGKAKNLKKRLLSYLPPPRKTKDGLPSVARSAKEGPWKESFKRQIADFDVMVVTSELEALLLETNLIKQLRPKYNVLMKDDKSYLFIRISTDEDFPHVETIRRFEQDGAKYFGPYMNGWEIGQALDLLHEAIGYRACKESIEKMNRGKQLERPCLDFQIGRCNGLCAGKITKEEYRSRIDQIISYLKGQKESVRGILFERMQAAAKDRKFELAAKLRNYLNLVEGKVEQQVAADGSGEDADILGVAILSNRAHVVVLHRRNGRLIGENHFALSGQAESIPAVLEQFIPQFYDDGREIPETVIIPESPPEGSGIMEKLLRERRKRAMKLIVPERGKKSRLLQIAERNAREKARQMELKWEAEERNTKGALDELAEILNLKGPPRRIEGYDISHLGGTETVGSMVVMKDGKAANDLYRSFTIRTLKSGQVDDYKAIREVLARRMRRLTEDLPQEEKRWNENGITFGKAVKKEQKTIEDIHAIEDLPLSPAGRRGPGGGGSDSVGIAYKTYLVARHDGDIVGFGRLIKHPQGIVEMKSIWVNESFRGGQLGQFIIRKILRSVKKGKVYVTIIPDLEEYYARIGFRYVINPPQGLPSPSSEGEGTEVRVVMMWETHQNKVDPSLTSRPDLIVIDGGKGQLSTAVEVLNIYQSDIPVIGLAKREEEIFIPGQSNPVSCSPESPAKFLLMRLRDEAHRFSNAHREKRAKHSMKASQLDEIPGLGEDTKKKLFAKFGSISAIKEAHDEQLLEILSKPQLESLRNAS